MDFCLDPETGTTPWPVGLNAVDAHLKLPAVSQLAETDEFIICLSQGSPDGIRFLLEVLPRE